MITRALRLLAALGLVGLTVVLPAPAVAADRVVETAVMVPGTPEANGTAVDLDVTVMTTDPQQPRPAIMLAHGFGGTKDDSAATGRELARDGYAVIIYTARGFGASGGLIHLDDPDFEGADTTRLVDFAATRVEVAHTGNDPVIGFAGASYGGAVSFLAAGLDRRVDAIAPAFTWNSLPQALFPQNLTTKGVESLAGLTPAGEGVFKQRWASLLFRSGAGQAGVCGRFLPALCSAYQSAAETGRPDAQLTRQLERSSPARLLGEITAPTLIIAGEDDTLFPLDQADANLRGLPASTPAKMAWVPGGHDGGIDTADLVPQLEAWFGRYLKVDGTAADTQFSVAVPETSLVGENGESEPQTLITPAYPGRGAELAQQRFDLSGTTQKVLSPAGGTPTALTNLPGTGGALGAASSIAGYALGVLPGQSATFTTTPLIEPVDLIGSGRVELQLTSATSTATLFASVWDLGPDAEPPAGSQSSTGGRATGGPSSAVLPGLAVAPVRVTGLTPGQPVSLSVVLPAVAHQVPVGHRLQVVVSSNDQAYAVPTRPAEYQVDLAGDRALSLPRLTATAADASSLDVPLPLVIVVAVLALAGLAAAFWLWRSRRVAHPRADLTGVPLVVEDLVKTYGDGFRAVDGVSFRAEAGQVVGLLGPNGAGKTTTMRMLVGLIRPDSGAVYVEGEPVHAGADVLGSVGAFIEGPGFLPHLTGMANLNAFWEATGRPAEEAHLDEALEIAGLGNAVHRRVRGYSQGMRQRLGIAQAMLGLPRLLLLDEPTNGLDPPQIKAMRSVLASYAAAGRTVVVSSHLLSEVEHTCSHVVVMNRGRVVLTGSMADLTASDDVTLIGLAPGSDGPAAVTALTERGLLVEADGPQLRVTGELPRPQIVAELVADGFAVESVDGRRQLEEVFMTLVGAPAAGPADSDEDTR